MKIIFMEHPKWLKEFRERKAFFVIIFLTFIVIVLSVFVYAQMEEKYGAHVSPLHPVTIPPAGFI